MTKYGRIYIIRNTINNKVYIGQTISSINLRFRNHLSAARNGGDYIIGKAIRKYGESNFYVELLEECLVEELNEREKYWISYYNAVNSNDFKNETYCFLHKLLFLFSLNSFNLSPERFLILDI